MYLGRVVERASVDELFDDPKHPYTRALMRSIPHLGAGQRGRLHVIQGSVPGAYTQVSGCPFHPRCPAAMPGLCDVQEPQLRQATSGAEVSCFLYHHPDGTPVAAGAVAAGTTGGTAAPGPETPLSPPAPTAPGSNGSTSEA
jgi:peptide/nickel transport system ATP-binding protein